MTTITTSTDTTASAYSNQRKVDRCQNGVLWEIHWDGSSNTTSSMHTRYSTDNGATWTAGTHFGFAGTGVSFAPSASLFIDLDDYAHVVYKDRHDGYIYYRRGTPNAGRTAWTWSSAFNFISAATLWSFPDVIAHREGSGWVAHIVASRMSSSSNDTVSYQPVTITSTGTITMGTDVVLGPAAYGVSAHKFPSIDFNHTGDGKTVAGGTPHLYAAWSAGTTGAGKGIRFRKAGYSGGSWTWGTEREIDSASAAYSDGVSSIFDGSRCVIAYADSAATSSIKVRERDAGDTTTTTRTPTALSDGAVEAISVSYDGDADIHLWAVGATSKDVKRVEYDRSANAWNAWATVAAVDALPDTLSLKRGYSNTRIEAVYTTGTASPYNVAYGSLVLNNPPNAPTWDITDNQARDVNATLTLDWTFNDPDAGDTQSAYAMRRQIGSGTYAYWNAGTSAWEASEVQNTSTTTALTLAAGWGADADANHKYAVKTWDAAGLAGPYSAELTVIPSAKDNPTLSAPADDGTITTASVTGEWTVATQTAYRARLLSSGGAELRSTGKVTSTATTHTFSDLDNSTTYKFEIVTWNDEGLQSTADTHTFSTSFTPPATPTLTVTANSANAAITVAITNPGTGATVTSNEVHVRVAPGGRKDVDRTTGGDGIRIATGIPTNGTFVDRAVASGIAYEYRAKAIGSNGTSAWSAWTA